MAVKLHRCPLVFVKVQAHPCWRVQSALNEQGIAYDVVKGPVSKGKRTVVQKLSGQNRYPVVEFEDGTVYREWRSVSAVRDAEERITHYVSLFRELDSHGADALPARSA